MSERTQCPECLEIVEVGSLGSCPECGAPILPGAIRQEPQARAEAAPKRSEHGSDRPAKRAGAYLIDFLLLAVPIALAYNAFNPLWDSWVARKIDPSPETREAFLFHRNRLRDLVLLAYTLYSTGLDATPWQGTLGKMVMGIKSVDEHGKRLTLGRAVGRNLARIISFAVCGLGFLSGFFHKERLMLHDTVSKTRVVRRRND